MKFPDLGHREDPTHIGTHLICDMWSTEIRENPKEVEKLLVKAAELAKATVLDVRSHKFEPEGLTAIVVLAESHISLHSWPEYNYVAIDVFTCGKQMDPQVAIDYLAFMLKPKKIETQTIIRGEDHASKS